jgi:23S rRNA (adenine2503-C2)-methyltransferase
LIESIGPPAERWKKPRRPTLSPATVSDDRPDLLGMTRARLAEALAPWIDRPYRAGQVYDALHRRGVADFEAITDLARPLRAALAERFRIDRPELVERRPAPDGTVKHLLRLADGATVEAVDILDDRGRHTLCLSSQAGCALACAFCVTGYWGAGRNLTAGEIVGQVRALRAAGDLPAAVNLVFMGMGEPLLNLGALEPAFEILAEGVAPRRITVSTAGVVPGIEALARWPRRPNLAVSLHAADDALRSRIMPVNRTWPLAELMAALRRYPLEPGRRLTFEYILIRDVNDGPVHADALARLLAGLRAKVNLIPINPDPVLGERMVPPDDAAVDAFHRRLKGRGLVSTVRRRRGLEVSAACGQLRAFGREPRGLAGRNLGGDYAGRR